jgi:hypothetical protein
MGESRHFARSGLEAAFKASATSRPTKKRLAS